MSKISKGLLIFSVLFADLCMAAHSYSQTHNSNSIPPQGTLIDAGGHKLHLITQGKGSPTVVFENGSADFSFIWSLVQPQVAKFTGTVSYDRAGYAWSEPGPMPRTSKQICLELHTALMNAGVRPPYILVGQSFGGFIVRAYARHYPKDVVGMVLVEAVQEDQRIFMGGDTPNRIRNFAKGRVVPAPQEFFSPQKDTAAQPTTLNTEIDPPLDKLPDSIQKMQIWAQSQPGIIKAVGAEMEWSPEDVADLYKHQGEAAYMLDDMPLIILTRGKGGFDGRKDSLQLEKERLQAQRALTHLSTNSKQVIDMKSGHNIHVEDPPVVVAAIREVFLAATNHHRLKK
jgi:pimeloyl-ACP methyl ester carboxylesterase